MNNEIDKKLKAINPDFCESLCATQDHQQLWTLIRQMSDPDTRNTWPRWYEPFWWKSVTSTRVRLRRRDARDASFLRSLWQNQTWLNLFNPSAQPLPTSDQKLNAMLMRTFNHSILKTKSIHWIGESNDEPVALVSIVNISVDHSRGEFLMGAMPGTSPFISARLAKLALKFWFQDAKMQKLTSLIHCENGHSIKSTQHLGFRHEGTLKEHLFDMQKHCFVDLHCYGLTRNHALQQLENSLFRRLG